MARRLTCRSTSSSPMSYYVAVFIFGAYQAS